MGKVLARLDFLKRRGGGEEEGLEERFLNQTLAKLCEWKKNICLKSISDSTASAELDPCSIQVMSSPSKRFRLLRTTSMLIPATR